MLDASLKAQLATYLAKIQQPIELVAALDDRPASSELRSLLEEIAALSGQITVRLDGQAARRPSFSVGRLGDTARIHFAGLPMGHEFTSLVLALLHTGGHPPKVDAEMIERIRSLPGPCQFETYIALSCHNCPDVVQALNLMAVLNPRIESTMIDGALQQQEVDARGIMAVPTVFLNGEPFGQGRMSLEEIVNRLDTGASAREAAKLNGKEVFDVLVVGGGPAGGAAAIYAARKGIRTGLLAERFGGQMLDTLAIENFISVPHTEGPRLAAALEQHIREYGVDLMTGQRAAGLVPADQTADSLTHLRLACGAVLRAKTVVLALGARWRELNVPGEKEYQAKGVCFCPHCDGPLFKGKRVAVIGGGNSGVEAAIDLAGLVSHVTLLEFDGKLRADAVLQDKLARLPNVTVIKNALTTAVLGDGQKVTGLSYTDRTSNESHNIALEGIFVQIGLLPNTDWLKGVIDLNRFGEIEIDARGHTSLPGVFAAGDCTTVPYKQIIVAMGEGAKAALSAFDHLIRSGR